MMWNSFVVGFGATIGVAIGLVAIVAVVAVIGAIAQGVTKGLK